MKMYYNKNDFDVNDPLGRKKMEAIMFLIAAGTVATIFFVMAWTHGKLEPLKAFINLYIPMGL
jgi:hypothetical protein